jgi:hypothetical protein
MYLCSLLARKSSLLLLLQWLPSIPLGKRLNIKYTVGNPKQVGKHFLPIKERNKEGMKDKTSYPPTEGLGKSLTFVNCKKESCSSYKTI